MFLKPKCRACVRKSLAFPGFELVRDDSAAPSSDEGEDFDVCECDKLPAFDVATLTRQQLMPDDSVANSKGSSTENIRRGAVTQGGVLMPLLSLSKPVVFTDVKCPWKFAELELVATGAYDNPDLLCLALTVVMVFTEEPVFGQYWVSSHYRHAQLPWGAMALVPAGDIGRWSTRHAHTALQLTIKSSLVNEIARDFGLSDHRFELPFIVPFDDDFARATLIALQAEAKAGYPSGQTYGDSLASALAAHLLSRYNVHAKKVMEVRGGLSKMTLQSLKTFIDENFHRDIGLTELSAIASMSPFHFSRLFKESTGFSPHQYLIHFRVKRARELLKTGGNLKQIARAVGFWDASHLTRHFKRVYGVAPSELFN